MSARKFRNLSPLILFGTILFATMGTAHAADIQFGFANKSGTQLLVVHEINQPESYKQAICNGEIYSIAFQKFQNVSSEKSTSRETADNFDKVPGNIYGIEGDARPKEGTGTCLLFEAGEVLKPIKLAKNYTPCTAIMKKKLLPYAEGWVLSKCLMKSNVQAKIQAGLIDYHPKDTQGMGQLFVANQQGVYTVDFPGQPCWRVDGECSFITKDPNALLEVSFVVEMKSGLGVFVIWPGAEGEWSAFYEVQSGKIKQTKDNYRYWSPI